MCSASLVLAQLRLARKAVGARDRDERGEEPADLGLHRSGSCINVIHLPLPKSGMRSPMRSGVPRSRSACSSPAPGCIWRACSVQASRPPLGVLLKLVLMPASRSRLRLWLRPFRHQPRDRRRLHGGPDLAERLCAGAADGRRRAAARADHHAADHRGRDHDADRDRAVVLGDRQHDVDDGGGVVRPVQHHGQPGRAAAMAERRE